MVPSSVTYAVQRPDAMKALPRAAVILSLVSLACAAAAAVTTLLWSGSFPEPSPAPAFNGALAEARGWSAATLGLALPLMGASLLATRRGSLRARLVWLGTLAYLVYTYLEFAVSPPFTALYLVYVSAFGCAIAALVMGATSLDMAAVTSAFADRVPRRTTAAFGLVSSLMLAGAWLKEIVARSLAGDFGWPQGEDAIRHVVHALDLGLQVPLGIAAGLLLFRRRPYGYVVAAILLVNAVCMGAALTTMVAFSARASGRSVLAATPFALVAGLAITLAWAFFRSMRDLPKR